MILGILTISDSSVTSIFEREAGRNESVPEFGLLSSLDEFHQSSSSVSDQLRELSRNISDISNGDAVMDQRIAVNTSAEG